MQIHRKLMLIAVVAMIAGIAGLAPFAYFWAQNRTATAQNTVMVPAVAPKPDPKPTLITGKPVRLQIPSLSLDLAIADGAFNQTTGSWTLSSDKAHYALPSMQPNNEQGNTLLYGHYRPEVFARLHRIAPGAQVAVLTDNGHRFTYTYQKSETVDPTNTDIFAYQGAPQLTIQTCTGAWMQNRQLFYFSLAGIE